MSSGTFETARTFPQHVFSNRFETRLIKGTSTDETFDLSEVDNGKFLSVALGTGNVKLALPACNTCVGLTVHGVVLSSTSAGTLTIGSASASNADLLYSLSLANAGVTAVSTASGSALVVPNISAGSTFTIFCTGVKWVVTAVASKTAPVAPPP